MATRCLIAQRITEDSKAVESIYCHWDGYPGGVGKTLLEHYQDQRAIDRLLSLGDRSSLTADPEIGEIYGRDRGEKGTESHVSANLKALLSRAEDCGAEFIYLRDLKNIWLFMKLRDAATGWHRLTPAVVEMKA